MTTILSYSDRLAAEAEQRGWWTVRDRNHPHGWRPVEPGTEGARLDANRVARESHKWAQEQRRAASSEYLTEEIAELFEAHEIEPGARLDKPAITELAEILHTHAERSDPHGWVEPDLYPVAIEVTNRYVIWVEATDATTAIRAIQEDGEWYERLGREPAVDSWHHVDAANHSEQYESLGDLIGPRTAPAKDPS